MLFGWKGIKGDDFKAVVETGAGDEEMAQWVDETRRAESDEKKQRMGDEIDRNESLSEPGKTRMVRRADETARARPGKDHSFRVARRRR